MASISYIITTYNRPQSLLNRAINSIILERLEDDSELIVVDDCSNEAVVIAPWVKNTFGGRVQLIRNLKNEGVIKSRNIGLMAAQHEYVLFLDDDDVSYPNRSRDLLAFMEGSAHAFVAGRIRLYDNATDFKVVPAQYDLPLSPLHYLCNPAHINSIIWKRAVLVEMNGFDNRIPYLGEHVTMLLLILRGAEVRQIDAIVSQCQPIEGGLTNVSKHHNLIKQYLIELVTILLQEPLHPYFRQVCEEGISFLNNQETISLDGFIAFLNQHNSIIDTPFFEQNHQRMTSLFLSSDVVSE